MLQKLELGRNSLSGQLPETISKLSQLESLAITGNRFSGRLDSVFSLPKLQTLDASHNFFSGELTDTTVARTKNLSALVLAQNCLAPVIPAGLCSLKNLSILVLDGVASNCRHLYTDAFGDETSGRLPHCLWSLPRLGTSISAS